MNPKKDVLESDCRETMGMVDTRTHTFVQSDRHKRSPIDRCCASWTNDGAAHNPRVPRWPSRERSEGVDHVAMGTMTITMGLTAIALEDWRAHTHIYVPKDRLRGRLPPGWC